MQRHYTILGGVIPSQERRNMSLTYNGVVTKQKRWNENVLPDRHRNSLEARAEQFKNPIACIDIETGEGYCRIEEIWEREGITVVNS